MRILFMLADLPGKGKANVNIAYKLMEELQNKHTVYIFGKYELLSKKDNVIQLSFIEKIYCLYVASKFKFLRGLIRILFNKRLKKYFSSGYEVFYRDMLSRVANIVKINKIDLIIVFSEPHLLNDITLNSNIDVPIYLYMLDPFFSHYLNNEKKVELEKIENAWINNAKHVFCTNLIYNDYCKSKLIREKLNKVSIVNFPSINNIQYSHNTINNQEIIIGFFGNLYHDIRNPENIIKILESLKNRKIKCIFYCNLIGFNKNYKKNIKKQYSFVEFYNLVPQDKLAETMNKCHILLNIGNSITNQMPSKIIEYINTGKPILNFCQISNDPTVSITHNYDLCLNVFSEKININEIGDFILNNYDKQIDKYVILEKYNTYTSQYIANYVESKIEELTNE